VPESFTQVPPNSTGNKMRTRSRVIGADTVHEQGVFQTAAPTYMAVSDATAFANSKHHITLFNAAGSGSVLSVKKLYAINLQTGAVTGAALRMDVRKCSAASAGTVITPETMDTTNPALPAEVTVRTGGTVTAGNLLYPMIVVTEEYVSTQVVTSALIMAATNWQPESAEIQELRLREGQGVTVQQITNATVGSFAWVIVFTVDED
jgi:hypothetical protein